jgi:hypothetical protein
MSNWLIFDMCRGRTTERLSIAAALLCCAPAITAEAGPKTIATLDLRNQFPAAISTTLVFANEETIAIAGYPGSDGSLSGTIALIEWRDGKLRPLQSKPIPLDRPAFTGELHVVSGGNIFSAVTATPQLLSRGLTGTNVPIKGIYRVALRGDTAVAAAGFERWNMYALDSPLSPLRTGRGEVLSVSNDLIVITEDHRLLIEKVDGTVEGLLEPQSACDEKAMLLGRNRLLMNGCNKDRVVDFKGKQLSSMPARDGWGFRQGLSLDGNRVLFDDYTRRISMLQRIHERFEDLISLGMGVPVESKGEEVRVVDTETGAICFDLDSPDHLFGRDGEYHADISPSGHYVAVVERTNLSLYGLPVSCAAQ